MELLSFPVILLLILAVDAAHDPRKLRIGVGLMVLLSIVSFGALGFILSVLSTIEIAGGTFLGAWLLLALFILVVVGVIALGVALVVNGLTMLRLEGRALAHMLSFFLGLGILSYIIVGIAAALASYVELVALLLVLAFPIGWIGFGLISYVTYSFLYIRVGRRWGSPVGAIVILGAGVPDGKVRPLLASRIREGIRWQAREDSRGRRPLLLMSGGQGSDEPLPEAEAMAKWAIDHGADSSRILRETHSTTTEENLRYSKGILDALQPGLHVTVVTSGYHAFRAATLMRAQNIPGYAIGAPTARYYLPSAMLREYVALLRDHLWLNIVALGALMMPFVFAVRALVNNL